MKKIYLLAISFLLFNQNILAMPCDYRYECTSQSKEYKIEIGTCSNGNNLSIYKVTIKNKIITQAKAGPTYDGTIGENEKASGTIAFQVDLPQKRGDDEDIRRILTVEIPGSNNPSTDSAKGVIRELISNYNPGPFKLIKKEPIVCESV